MTCHVELEATVKMFVLVVHICMNYIFLFTLAISHVD